MKTFKSNNECAETRTTASPFGDYPGQFRKVLESQHYAQTTVAEYVRCIGALGQRMRESGVDMKDLDEDRAVDLIVERRRSRRKFSVYIVKRFVKFLTDSSVATTALPPTPYDSARECLRQDYEEYLRCQRGLSEETIYHCWRFAERFLKFHSKGEESDLSRITPSDITGFMQHLTSRGKPFRSKTLPTFLRNFFLFLFKSGKTATNLAPSIPRIAQRHGATLPRHLTPE